MVIVEHHNTVWVTIPAMTMIGREIIISALREWMAELGKRSVAVSWIGKWKTMIQMVSLTGLIWQYDIWMVWLASCVALRGHRAHLLVHVPVHEGCLGRSQLPLPVLVPTGRWPFLCHWRRETAMSCKKCGTRVKNTRTISVLNVLVDWAGNIARMRSHSQAVSQTDAGIAQLVEHDLAKVGVASSSLVSRSKFNNRVLFFAWRVSKAVMQRIANPFSPFDSERASILTSPPRELDTDYGA